MVFNPSPIYHLYVLFVEISYQARFCLQILYPEIFFTLLQGILNHGSFIVRIICIEMMTEDTVQGGGGEEWSIPVNYDGKDDHNTTGMNVYVREATAQF